MSLVEWWRARHSSAGGGPDPVAVGQAVERIVQTANPRLRFVRRHAQRLTPAVASAMAYATEAVAALPAVHAATAGGWAAEPAVRASFATAGDIVQAFSRAAEVRSFFDRNPQAQEVFAVVGMRMTEKRAFGMDLQGSVIQRDVLQTKLSFGDYRVRILGASEADLRMAIEQRIVDELVLDGIGRAAAEQTRRQEIEQEQLLLRTRLRYLEQQGRGMRAALGGDAENDQAALTRVQAALEENTRALENMATGADRLDEELDQIVDSLTDGRQRFCLATTRLRLDRMNVLQIDDSPESGEEIVIHLAQTSADPPETRAFLLVRFPRADMLPADTLRAEALRELL